MKQKLFSKKKTSSIYTHSDTMQQHMIQNVLRKIENTKVNSIPISNNDDTSKSSFGKHTGIRSENSALTSALLISDPPFKSLLENGSNWLPLHFLKFFDFFLYLSHGKVLLTSGFVICFQIAKNVFS